MLLTKIQHRHNPQYINLSLVLFTDQKGDSLLNYSITANTEMLKFMLTFTFSLPKNDDDKEYQNRVLRSTVDTCKMRAGSGGNFLVKMLMENFLKSADFSLRCPMKAGTYNLWNFKVSDSFIPSYLLLSDFKFMIDMNAKVKIPGAKQLVNFYSLKISGEVNKIDWKSGWQLNACFNELIKLNCCGNMSVQPFAVSFLVCYGWMEARIVFGNCFQIKNRVNT